MDPPRIAFFSATPEAIQPGGTSNLTCLGSPEPGTVTHSDAACTSAEVTVRVQN